MNGSMQNKTAVCNNEKGFLLFQMLKVHVIISEIFGEAEKSEYSTLRLFYQLIFDMTLRLKEQQLSTYLKPSLPPEAQFYSLYF